MRAPAYLWKSEDNLQSQCSPSIMWALALNLGHQVFTF